MESHILSPWTIDPLYSKEDMAVGIWPWYLLVLPYIVGPRSFQPERKLGDEGNLKCTPMCLNARFPEIISQTIFTLKSLYHRLLLGGIQTKFTWSTILYRIKILQISWVKQNLTFRSVPPSHLWGSWFFIPHIVFLQSNEVVKILCWFFFC